jgi:hypothetical protein
MEDTSAIVVGGIAIERHSKSAKANLCSYSWLSSSSRIGYLAVDHPAAQSLLLGIQQSGEPPYTGCWTIEIVKRTDAHNFVVSPSVGCRTNLRLDEPLSPPDARGPTPARVVW